MTIALSMKINDGIVLAADSATTIVGGDPTTGQAGVVNIYNNANKVFNLKKGLPIGAITWGSGSIGLSSVSTLNKDLRKRFSGDDEKHPEWKINPLGYQVRDIAEKFKQFIFDEQYRPAFEKWPQKPVIGFIIAGYSTGEAMAEEYQIDVTATGECVGPRPVRGKDEVGITWSGMPEAITRFLLGYSEMLPAVLEQRLGVPHEQVGPAIQIIRNSLQIPFVLPAMPLQDAIDLAEFLVYATIQFAKFGPGAPTVGGPIEVAAISKHEGYKWIQRKYYFTRELNPEETE